MAVKPNATTLVDLGSYKLEVTIRGPPRRAHNPIVVIIPDIASSIKEWNAVTQLLAESMSVVNYERAGYGQSDPAPANHSRSGEDIAQELHELLRAAKITPPYIMIGHSYGSTIVREFVKLRNLAQFKGFVFLNAVSFAAPLKFLILNLLKLCYEDSHHLGESAWKALLEEEARPEHRAAAEREIAAFNAVKAGLVDDVEQPVLGRVPLIVLHADFSADFDKFCTERVRLGTGTEADKKKIQEAIEEATKRQVEGQRKLLKMSERSKAESISGFGYRVHLTAPERIADTVTWILMQYRC
ncbi:alpha/beta hydrolase [Fusarium austroafricanum]|uniref:Alpha/beta hydrolase n=1 Tax=Fusarium austroafricanum TaxID=2364996 RepID=A0A8H4KCL7_9HYPO|nr:alpha/beta hydrolase [Fusarium austroafricanum]